MKHPGGIETARPIIEAQNIVFMDGEGILQVYGITGEPVWSSPWAHNRRDLLSATFVEDGHLVVGSSFGQLGLFSPLGELLWRERPGKRIERVKV